MNKYIQTCMCKHDDACLHIVRVPAHPSAAFGACGCMCHIYIFIYMRMRVHVIHICVFGTCLCVCVLICMCVWLFTSGGDVSHEYTQNRQYSNHSE